MDIRERQLFARQAHLCQVLTDPSRLALIHLIGAGERTVGELVAATGLRQDKVSQHLAILRQRGVVITRRDGTAIHYTLAHPAILEACAIMRGLLMRQLEAASELIERATR